MAFGGGGFFGGGGGAFGAAPGGPFAGQQGAAGAGADGDVAFSIPAGTDSISTIQWSPDGKFISAGTWDNKVRGGGWAPAHTGESPRFASRAGGRR